VYVGVVNFKVAGKLTVGSPVGKRLKVFLRRENNQNARDHSVGLDEEVIHLQEHPRCLPISASAPNDPSFISEMRDRGTRVPFCQARTMTPNLATSRDNPQQNP
jgi:hypothetical protein